MVVQYIGTRTIMDICDELVRRLGTHVSNKWWYQERIHLEEERAEVEVKMSGETEETEGKAEVIALN